MNVAKRTALGPLLVGVAVVVLVAACSSSPAASVAPAGPSRPDSAVTSAAPSTQVAQMAPACAPPEAAVGGTVLNEWAASAGRLNTLAGSLAFDLRGGSVTKVEIVVGTSDAVSDPTELSSAVSARVLARNDVPGFGSGASASSPFSIDFTPPQSGRLRVFALVQYTTGASCGGVSGTAAQPLGWITVS